MPSRLLLCACALLSLTAQFAPADEKYDLSPRLRPGQSWSFNQVAEAMQKCDMSSDTQPPYQAEQRIRVIRKGTVTILAVSNGLPSSIRIAFDPACANKIKQNGQEQTINYPLAGLTIKLTRDANGRVTEELPPDFRGQLDPTLKRDLEACFYTANEARPSQPVSIGQQWDLDLTLAKQAYQLTDKDKAVGAAKLAAITPINNRNAAEVIIYSKITKQQGELTATEENKGSLWFDLETGQLVQSSLDANTTTQGIQPMPGPNGQPMRVRMNNSGIAQTRVQTTPGDPGTAPALATTNTPAANPLAAPSTSTSDPWPGTYRDDQVTFELQSSPDRQYSGQIVLKDQKFPLSARADGKQLTGSFRANGSSFDFTATSDGNTVNLVTAGTTYRLKKQAANPLATPPQPTNPLAGSQSSAQPTTKSPVSRHTLPTDYTVIASAGAGQTLFALKPGATTPQTAIRATLSDLAQYFDAKPTLREATADSRSKRSAAASFTAQLQGQPIKGNILCGLDDRGAAISVLYNRADAPASEWAALANALPAPAKAREFTFQDGTGSVQLPDGWKTSSTSVVGGVSISGPADQKVTLGSGISVLTPDSFIVTTYQEMLAQSRMMGAPPPPPLTAPVAPFTGPADALKNILPQLSYLSQQKGGPAIALERIIDAAAAEPRNPQGKAAIVHYVFSLSHRGQTVRHRSLAQMETYPIGDGCWGIFFTELQAPEAAFERDLPTMWDIAHSLNVNGDAVARVTHDNIQRNNANIASIEKSIKENNAAFDSLLKSMKKASLVRSRCNDNFDEIIRGYRMVTDNRTGERRAVDLAHVDDVVAQLNATDPGRYTQIPLADLTDPIK